MNNYLKLYWLTRLDGIVITCAFIMVLGIILTIAHYVYAECEYYDEAEKQDFFKRTRFGKRCMIFLISISTATVIFLPCKDDAIFIIAGGKTMDFIQSDTSINKIPAQTTKLITDYLQEQLNDAKK